MSLIVLVPQFLLCAVLIAGAGYVLCQSADHIAKATGLTGGWTGLAMLATVTSLPELASASAPSRSSVRPTWPWAMRSVLACSTSCSWW